MHVKADMAFAFNKWKNMQIDNKDSIYHMDYDLLQERAVKCDEILASRTGQGSQSMNVMD